MKVETYKCDRCGKAKGDVNHWWKSVVVEVPTGDLARQIAITSLDSREPLSIDGREIHHLCGQACVIAEVNQFMQGVSE